MMKKNILYILAICLSLGVVGLSDRVYAASFTYGSTTYSCAAGSTDVVIAKELCVSSCFVKDTLITMANGSKRNIQDIQVGDILKGSKGNNTVLKLIHKNSDSNIYSFNGGRFFVTDSHPFKTIQGWKSINPEATQKINPELLVSKIHEGDMLVTEDGVTLLTTIRQEYNPQTVYTFEVDGTHDYYADGYLVHNKNACDASVAVYTGEPPLTEGAYRVCNFATQSCNDIKLGNMSCNVIGKADVNTLPGGITCENTPVCKSGEKLISKTVNAPSAYIPATQIHGRTDNCGIAPNGTKTPWEDSYVLGTVLWDSSHPRWNDKCLAGKINSNGLATPTNCFINGEPEYYCRNGTINAGGTVDNGCGWEKTADPITVLGCVPDTCNPDTKPATVCSLTDPLVAGVCYQPAIGVTTLLVKDGRVAINAANVDSGATLLVVGVSGSHATEMLNLSDIRIKTNITRIDNALANITKLNGYTFTWKESGKPDFGVLAQEVEKVFASMVSTDANGIKAVNYTELLAPIIEAIHDINTRIDELTTKAQAQSARLDALKK